MAPSSSLNQSLLSSSRKVLRGSQPRGAAALEKCLRPLCLPGLPSAPAVQKQPPLARTLIHVESDVCMVSFGYSLSPAAHQTSWGELPPLLGLFGAGQGKQEVPPVAKVS